MPKAVVDNEYEKFELDSCEGGFIELKPMAYGDVLERNGMSLKMSTQMQEQGNRKQRRGGQSSAGAIDFQLSNREVTLFEYQKCVGAHNLEDANGQLLDLKTPQGISQLHPKIGAEIGELINEMNAFDTEGKSE